MGVVRLATLGFVVLAMLAPSPSPAQSLGSSIVGVAKDQTGAVLPGVVIEVSSPALIGGVQTVITNSAGEYRIVDLRPGSYTLTYKLDGFQTIRREGVSLSASFTATINVEMAAATLSESITVTGESPLVDVRTNVSDRSINQALLESVPNARGIFAVVSLVPGIAINSPDVGGSQTHQSPRLSLHGSVDQDVSWYFDGLDVTGNVGNGGYNVTYYNQGVQEEVSVQSKALPAETGGGGIYVNIVTKDGGNRFKGSLFTSYTGQSLQSRNVSSDQAALGLKAPAGVDSLLDFNPVFGGPVVKDQLWFVGSYRYWRNDRFVASTFTPDGSQALDPQLLLNYSGKMTSQISASNRVSFFMDWNIKHRPNRRDLTSAYQFVSPEAAKFQRQGGPVMNARWTSTIRPNFLFEAGVSALVIDWTLRQQPGVDALALPRNDIALSTLTGSLETNSRDEARNRTVTAIASWFPSFRGSHSVKFGMQYNHAPYRNEYSSGGLDLTAKFQNSLPNSVSVWNTPTQLSSNIVDMGAFVQDSWTIRNRLTLNLGTRFERYVGTINPQVAAAGTFVTERRSDRISNVPNWNSFVPRLAVVYDVTGDSKTAIKANISKYMQKLGISFLNTVNPMRLTSESRTWVDANSDRFPQLIEIGPSRGTLTQGVSVRLDPDLRRPSQWEGNITLERQVTKSVGMAVAYFRRQYYASYQTVNLALSDADYTPVTIVSPLDGQPFTVYNQTTASVGRFDNTVRNFDELGVRYNGFEVTFDKRFANKFAIFGGYTYGVGKQCTSASTNPNDRINTCGYQSYDSTNIANVSGVYQLPGAFQLSGHFQYKTGQPQSRTFTVTRTQVPNLTQVTQNVLLASAGSYRYPSLTVLDLRVSKRFKVGSLAFEPTLDAYNLLNENAAINQVQTVGPALGQIVQNVDGRTVRFGATLQF
jgi:hypothetical protein